MAGTDGFPIGSGPAVGGGFGPRVGPRPTTFGWIGLPALHVTLTNGSTARMAVGLGVIR
jgi:hypothetical protein